ncbi:MAG: hypothetical protein ACK5LY_08955 [Lachnospirales bacterium]
MIDKFKEIHYSFLLEKSIFILQDNVLHSLFLNTPLLKEGESYPLQEVFSYGSLAEDIFSFDFISIRSEVLGCSESEYINKNIKPLRYILESKKNIVFYFSKNMSSLLNLIVLLAFFEENGFKNDVNLVLFDERDEEDITIRKIKLGDFSYIYKNIIFSKNTTKMSTLKCDKIFIEALVLYLHYNMENNEIKTFINEHINKISVEDLYPLVFDKFKIYGFKKCHLEKLMKRNF